MVTRPFTQGSLWFHLGLNWTLFGCLGVVDMECYDRYLLIAVDLSLTGVEPSFEAVGKLFFEGSHVTRP